MLKHRLHFLTSEENLSFLLGLLHPQAEQCWCWGSACAPSPALQWLLSIPTSAGWSVCSEHCSAPATAALHSLLRCWSCCHTHDMSSDYESKIVEQSHILWHSSSNSWEIQKPDNGTVKCFSTFSNFHSSNEKYSFCVHITPLLFFITSYKSLFHSLGESNFFCLCIWSLSWPSSAEMTSRNAAQDIAQTVTHSAGRPLPTHGLWSSWICFSLHGTW